MAGLLDWHTWFFEPVISVANLKFNVESHCEYAPKYQKWLGALRYMLMVNGNSNFNFIFMIIWFFVPISIDSVRKRGHKSVNSYLYVFKYQERILLIWWTHCQQQQKCFEKAKKRKTGKSFEENEMFGYLVKLTLFVKRFAIQMFFYNTIQSSDRVKKQW